MRLSLRIVDQQVDENRGFDQPTAEDKVTGLGGHQLKFPFRPVFPSFPFDTLQTLKEGHTDADVVDMVKEMEIMKSVGAHPNVIGFVGSCTRYHTKTSPFWISDRSVINKL